MAEKKPRKRTSLRLTEADEEILVELRQLTGLKTSQVYRAAIRALLRTYENRNREKS
jgi:hypothetical protein